MFPIFGCLVFRCLMYLVLTGLVQLVFVFSTSARWRRRDKLDEFDEMDDEDEDEDGHDFEDEEEDVHVDDDEPLEDILNNDLSW